MPTATKEKRTAGDIVEQMRADSETLFVAAERILSQVEHGDDPIDTADLAILRAAGIDVDDQLALQTEVARAVRASRNQATAGSKVEFARAQTALETATAAVADQSPTLRQQIEAAAAKLKALEQEQLFARERVTEMEVARSQLRDPSALPCHVRDKYNALKRETKAHYGKRINELTGQLALIDGVAQLHPTSREAMSHASVHLRAAIVRPAAGGKQMIDTTKWAEYVAGLQAQRPSVIKELAPLETRFAEEMALVEKLRNFYVDQLV